MKRFTIVSGAILAAGLVLGGCSSLLPRAESTVRAEWHSFDEAKAAIERLEPHRTTLENLHAAGFDPYTNPNVELLNYSDVLRRFPLSGSVTRLDPGLRECLEAGQRCTGYSIMLDQQHKDRVGPFLLDVLGFKRETVNTGWTFNAIVLVVNDRVVYALYGGKPGISEKDTSVQPLGPLQNWDASNLVK
jgi:hypothetical protein